MKAVFLKRLVPKTSENYEREVISFRFQKLPNSEYFVMPRHEVILGMEWRIYTRVWCLFVQQSWIRIGRTRIAPHQKLIGWLIFLPFLSLSLCPYSLLASLIGIFQTLTGKAVSFVEILVAHGSILTILAISFERYYAICRPLEAGYKCTKKRAFHIIVIIWLVATISTVPMLAISELHETKYIDESVVPVCSNSLQQGWHPMYFIFIIFTFFGVPFLILVVLYVLITKKLTSESRTLSSTSSNHRSKVRRQVVIMLASVCVAFFVCLLPFRLMTLWIIFSTNEDIVGLGAGPFYNLLFTCRILLYVNSSVNPILYNLISSKFRAAFRGILKRDTGSLSLSRSNEHSVLSERISASNFINNNSVRGTNFNNITRGTNGYQSSPTHHKYKNTVAILSKGTRLETSVDVHALWLDRNINIYTMVHILGFDG